MDGRRGTDTHIFANSAAVLGRGNSYRFGIFAYMALERLFSFLNVSYGGLSAGGLAYNDAKATSHNGPSVGTEPSRNYGYFNGGLSCFHTSDAYYLYICSALVY